MLTKLKSICLLCFNLHDFDVSLLSLFLFYVMFHLTQNNNSLPMYKLILLFVGHTCDLKNKKLYELDEC